MEDLYQGFRIIFNPISNILCIIVNLLIKRDKSVLLFGGRHGDRFAGNSRFLFQYCDKEKEKYGFQKVIWVTRKKEIYDEMTAMGYTCYMMYSLKSIYYHFKAGRHIIDGSYIFRKYSDRFRWADILSVLSYGAECIFLTHGAKGFKATDVGRTSHIIWNLYKRMSGNDLFKKYILNPGSWGNCITLRNHRLEGDNTCDVRIAGMPELCECIEYTPTEKRILEGLPKEKKLILYTPTVHMKKATEYKAPLNDASFCEYLLHNGFYWIEKLHPAASDDMKAENYDSRFSMLLDTRFDINVIIPKVDIMITDYSSTYQKAIWFNIPYTFYVSDIEYFTTFDTHIDSAFNKMASEDFCYNTEMLRGDIEKKLNSSWINKNKSKYKKLKEEYFNITGTSYEAICKALFYQ